MRYLSFQKQILFTAFLSLCSTLSLNAAEIKSGQQVMVTAQNAKIMQGTKFISKAKKGDIFIITQVNGAWLGVASRKGWILEEQVVPISQAVDHFTKKINTKPTPDNYFFRGVAYLIAKQNKKAINDFNEAIKRDSKKSDYLTNRGLAYLNLKQKKQAMADFSAAIVLNSKDANAYFNRSVLLMERKSFSKAMADLEASIKADNTYAPAYNNRGVLWRNKGEYAKAIEDYTQAIKLNAKYASAFTNRGYAKKKLGNYADAKKDYLTAIQLDPKDASPKNDLAWLLATCPQQKHRDGKEALKLAQTACQLWKHKNFNGLDTLAAAYAETGSYKEAIEWSELALKMAPQAVQTAIASRIERYKKQKPFHE